MEDTPRYNRDVHRDRLRPRHEGPGSSAACAVRSNAAGLTKLPVVVFSVGVPAGAESRAQWNDQAKSATSRSATHQVEVPVPSAAEPRRPSWQAIPRTTAGDSPARSWSRRAAPPRGSPMLLPSPPRRPAGARDRGERERDDPEPGPLPRRRAWPPTSSPSSSARPSMLPADRAGRDAPDRAAGRSSDDRAACPPGKDASARRRRRAGAARPPAQQRTSLRSKSSQRRSRSRTTHCSLNVARGSGLDALVPGTERGPSPALLAALAGVSLSEAFAADGPGVATGRPSALRRSPRAASTRGWPAHVPGHWRASLAGGRALQPRAPPGSRAGCCRPPRAGSCSAAREDELVASAGATLAGEARASSSTPTPA